MPYLIQGNAKDIFTAFGYPWIVNPQNNAREIHNQIELDFPRTMFLGHQKQINTYKGMIHEGYQRQNNAYTQGNLNAEILKFLFGNFPLLEEESLSNYKNDIKNLAFAFLDENNRPSALMLAYRKNNPGKWLIGLIKDTEKLPEERDIYFLSSQLVKPFSNENLLVSNQTIPLQNNCLFKAINQPLVRFFIEQAVTSHKGVNFIFNRIALFDLWLKNDYPNDLNQDFNLTKRILTEKNHVLDLLSDYNVQLPVNLLKKCLNRNSSLLSIIRGHRSSINQSSNGKDYIYLLIALYETGTFKKNRHLLENKDIWDPLHRINDLLGYSYLVKILKAPKLLSFILQIMSTNQFEIFLNHFKENPGQQPDFLLDLFNQSLSDWTKETLLHCYLTYPNTIDKNQWDTFKHILSSNEATLKQIGDGGDLIELLILLHHDNLSSNLTILLNGHLKPLLSSISIPVNAKVLKELIKTHIEESNQEILKLIPLCQNIKNIKLLNLLREAHFSPKGIQTIFESPDLLKMIDTLFESNRSKQIFKIYEEKRLIQLLHTTSQFETKALQTIACIYLAENKNISDDKSILKRLRRDPELCAYLIRISDKNNLEDLRKITLDPERYQLEKLYQKYENFFNKYNVNKQHLMRRDKDSLTRLNKRLTIFKELKFDNVNLFHDFLKNGKACQLFCNLNTFIKLLPPTIKNFTIPLLFQAATDRPSIDKIKAMNFDPQMKIFIHYLLDHKVKRNKSIHINQTDYYDFITLTLDQQLAIFSLPLSTLLLKNPRKARALNVVISHFKELEQEKQKAGKEFKIINKALILNQLIHHLEPKLSIRKFQNQLNNPLKKNYKAKTEQMCQWLDKIMLLQELKCSDKILKFVTHSSTNGQRFRRIIDQVEAETASIEQHLFAASNNQHKLAAFKSIKESYRKELYEIAYNRLNSQTNLEEFKSELTAAQSKISGTVNIDRHPYLRKFAMILANIVFTSCSLGIANLVHHQKTGNFFFFSKPKSAESIDKLHKDIVKLSLA